MRPLGLDPAQPVGLDAQRGVRPAVAPPAHLERIERLAALARHRPSARAPACTTRDSQACAASSNGAIVATPGAAHVQRTLPAASSACARRSNVNAGDAAATASPSSALRASAAPHPGAVPARRRAGGSFAWATAGARRHGGLRRCGGSRRADRRLGGFALWCCGHAALRGGFGRRCLRAPRRLFSGPWRHGCTALRRLVHLVAPRSRTFVARAWSRGGASWRRRVAVGGAGCSAGTGGAALR